MLTYWEEDLIRKGKNGDDKKLIFVENLKIFVENNKDEIEFEEVKAKSNENDVLYYEATTKGGTVYRQIEGITTKEDLLKWYDIFSFGKKSWSYKYMSNNIPQMAFRHIGNQFGEEFMKPPYKELCSDDEELFKGFSSSYFSGYSFNTTSPDTIYKNVYIYDFKSNHSAVMYNELFPSNFLKIKNSRFEEIYRKGVHFYGEFRLKVNKKDPFFHQFGELYNETTDSFHGYFNDIDFEFIDRLGDIEDVKCYRLWIVEMKPLPENLRTVIKTAFKWKEEADDKDIRKVFKLFLEKLYGECVRRRWFRVNYEWNTETKTLDKIKKEYDWEEIKQKLFRHYDYSWGVWTCSYVRLKLLRLRQQMGAAALYGDIDSIFFVGKENFKYIDEINKSGELLGSFSKEGFAEEIKFLDKKWYCYRGTDKNDEPTFVVKCSGANPQIVKEYLLTQEDSVAAFTKDFPQGVNPYKRIRKNGLGKLEYYWAGGSMQDRTSSDDKKVIVSCAGSGKTTTLINEVKKKFEETEDKITVIAFTNKNVGELRERIGINSSRLEIRTLDSLASSLLYGAIDGELFDAKLTAATEILISHPEAMPPSHLFVDEFQDLDLTKFNFINAIPCISRFYIGDPNQSIYGYSGAENLFNRLVGFDIENRFVNYRCPQNINDYAEGFLNSDHRPNAKSYLSTHGIVMFSTEIPDDDSIILCRTNSEVDKITEKYPARQVMTIHKSKGLTFDKITIIGIDKNMEDEEEQNIAYVACTRAKSKLTLVIGGV